MNLTTRTAARRTTALGLAAAGVLSLGLLAPAQADPSYGAKLTLRASDDAVSAGEQIVLRGRLVAGESDGVPVPDARIQVRTRQGDGFVAVSGAHVRTDSEGRYRVRVVLSRVGDRELRVYARTSSGLTKRSGVVDVQVG